MSLTQQTQNGSTTTQTGDNTSTSGEGSQSNPTSGDSTTSQSGNSTAKSTTQNGTNSTTNGTSTQNGTNTSGGNSSAPSANNQSNAKLERRQMDHLIEVIGTKQSNVLRYEWGLPFYEQLSYESCSLYSNILPNNSVLPELNTEA